MGYKPQVNNRKHKSLVGDALSLAEISSGKLAKLRDAAKNDATKAHIQGIENDMLKLQVTLHQVLELIHEAQASQDDVE